MQEIDYGCVFCASGRQGFFGLDERPEYKIDRVLKYLGSTNEGVTFTSKTTTFEERLGEGRGGGNLPMEKDGITPKEFFPACILPNFHPGNILLSMKMLINLYGLNAVSLSGPGLEPLLKLGYWQAMTKPFGISLMTLAETQEGRIADTRKSVQALRRYGPFKAPVFLQRNLSCPNVAEVDRKADEIKAELAEAAALGWAQMLKFNILAPVSFVKIIARDPNCAALFLSNTIHWSDLEKIGVNKKRKFGSEISPLARYKGGGYSGPELLYLTIKWIRAARAAGIEIPIVAGGGISHPNHVSSLFHAGASAISIGFSSKYRCWREKAIIERAHRIFS